MHPLFCLLLGAALGLSQPMELVSREQPSTLLELYTSQGCSSCPPADRWLGRLRDHPGLWTDLVPVAFHVDYWDGLGWADPFASPVYSDRQSTYRDHHRISAVYTPGFVRNGAEWRGWRHGEPPLKASTERVGRLSVRLHPEQPASLSFSPLSKTGEPLLFHMAVLGFGLETRVAAGENQGRILREDFVVLGYARHRVRPDSAGGYAGEWPLPAVTAPGATRHALAVWITPASSPVPIQATGGWLSAPPGAAQRPGL